jgi:uncharacterized protein
MTELPRRHPRSGEEPLADLQDRAHRSPWFHPKSMIRRTPLERPTVSGRDAEHGSVSPDRADVASQAPVLARRPAAPGSQPAVVASQPAGPGGQAAVPGSQPAVPVSQPAVPVSRPAVEQRVLAQLRWLRNEVPGIDGSIVATSDGLLITHDMLDLEPAQVAALMATTLSIARRAALLTSRGQLREAVVHGSTGYVAVFAIGAEAVLAVLGAKDLNVGMLHYQTREAVRRLEEDVDSFTGFASARDLRLPLGQGQQVPRERQ